LTALCPGWHLPITFEFGKLIAAGEFGALIAHKLEVFPQP
jgi:hypothetical protein